MKYGHKVGLPEKGRFEERLEVREVAKWVPVLRAFQVEDAAMQRP